MRTDFLFAMPSWWTGAARLFDLTGHFDEYNGVKAPNEADAIALYSDWRIVGDDLWTGMRRAVSPTATGDEPALVEIQ